MQYLLLIYYDPQNFALMSEDERREIGGRYVAFGEELRGSGKMLSGGSLQPIETATTVRVRNGKTLTADGPFSDAKEVLGGYYLIDAATHDEALEWAAKLPGATYGTVEVRPLATN